MRVTGKKVIALALVWAVSTVAAVALNLPTPEEEAEEPPVYYFLSCDSARDLQAVQIENAGGSVTLIQSEGVYSAYLGDTEAIVSEDSADQLFYQIYKLPLVSYLSGASASDSQYGLSEPLAEVYIQNTAGDAVFFYVGRASPSRGAYYVCLAGDERVFLMDGEIAELFLEDPSVYCLPPAES